MYVNKRPLTYRVRFRIWKFRAWLNKPAVAWAAAITVVAAGFTLVALGVR